MRNVAGRTVARFERSAKHSVVDLRQPVFVWGNGQSGSYLLFDVLALVGPFVFPYTTGARKKGFATQKYGTHEIRFDRKPIEGISAMWDGLIAPYAGGVHGAITAAMQAADVDRDGLKAVRARYSDLLRVWPWESHDRLRILDKSVNYVFVVELLEAAFPDALHIFCLRDPRMILSSILHRFKNPKYEEGWQGYPSGFYGNIMLSGHEAYRDASLERRHAWQIQRVLEIGLEACDRLGPRCAISRFEDLLSDPETEVRRLAGFARFDVDDGALANVHGSVHAKDGAVWPQDPTMMAEAAKLHIDVDAIADLSGLNEFAVRLGYHPTVAGMTDTVGNIAAAR